MLTRLRHGHSPLSLQFLLELVEEAPVGALRDELLRGRLDEPDFMQAQGEKAHRVFRVVLAPLAIRNLRIVSIIWGTVRMCSKRLRG